MFLKVNISPSWERGCYFPGSAPNPPPVLAVAHLYCVVFGAHFTTLLQNRSRLCSWWIWWKMWLCCWESASKVIAPAPKSTLLCSLFQRADGLTGNEAQRVRYGTGSHVGLKTKVECYFFLGTRMVVCEPGLALPAEPLVRWTDTKHRFSHSSASQYAINLHKHGKTQSLLPSLLKRVLFFFPHSCACLLFGVLAFRPMRHSSANEVICKGSGYFRKNDPIKKLFRNISSRGS